MRGLVLPQDSILTPQDFLMVQDPHAAAPEKEMSNFFDDLRNAWDRYGSFALWVVVITSFSYLAYSLVTYNRVTKQENAWSDLANSTAPASFEQVAQDHSNRAVSLLALLQAADMYLGETAALDEGDALTGKLDQAEALYQQVVNEATHDEYRINALEGLAVVAEGRRDLDEAAKRNEAVIALAGTMPGFETWTARANARKQLLPLLAEPEAFVEDTSAPAAEAEAADAEVPPAEADPLELEPITLPTE